MRAVGRRDRLAVWCGGVMVAGAVLTPLLAWLGPLGFAPLLALMGLLSLPAVRIAPADRLPLGALLVLVTWAVASTAWSPYRPDSVDGNLALKLAFELPLFWAAVCGARRAGPRLATAALIVLIVGMTAFGALLVFEAATGGAVYQKLHLAFYEPIRPDLAQKNVGQSTFALALLWPLLALAGARTGLTAWVAVPMVAGVGAAAWAFGFDAPLMSLALSPLVGLAIWLCPRTYPRLLAAKIAAFFLAAPLAMWALRQAVGLPRLQEAVALSWAQRLGYWSHAVDFIAQKPLRGWGLDASRTFAPAIELHPHDGALQIWLELGVVGAVAAAVFWAAALARLSRPSRDLLAAASGASAAGYLLFGAVNFGVWQEWWVALGALACVVAALVARTPARPST